MAKKNEPEIHPAVEAERVQAKRNAEAFSEATLRAVAEATAFADAMKRHRRKKVTLALLLRLLVAAALVFVVTTIRAYGHLSPEVTLVALVVLLSWSTLLIGAWMQFMWEGIFK